MRRGELALQLLVVDDPALLRVHEEHLARVQALLDGDVLRREVEHADLRRHDDDVVLGDVVARGAQAVAIEHGADDLAVAEGDGRRAVPRLHQRRVILVERAALGAHLLVVLPRLGDHHEHGVRQRPAAHVEELEHVVEGRRVRAPFADDGQDARKLLAEQVRLEQALARAHPVDVAAQRVDLAVVRDVAVRVGERPGGKRVGAEPLVHHRERALERGVAQVREHRRDLRGREHALVDQRGRREADDVEEVAFGRADDVDGLLEALADDVERALESGRAAAAFRAERRGHFADEQLFEDRLDFTRPHPEGGVVGRHASPAEQRLALLGDDARDKGLHGGALVGVARQEDQAGAVVAGGREGEAEFGLPGAEEAVRHLDEDAGAVAGVGLRSAGAAVLEVAQQAQALLDDVVRLASAEVDDKADAARVLLVLRVVKSLRLRQFTVVHTEPSLADTAGG